MANVNNIFLEISEVFDKLINTYEKEKPQQTHKNKKQRNY
jgi:hypothetical protein